MSDEWFARPVLFAADIDRSVDFYVTQLGFTQSWRYEEEGKGKAASSFFLLNGLIKWARA